MSAAATTPGKAEIKSRVKPPVPGRPMFGCEHLQHLFGFSPSSPHDGGGGGTNGATAASDSTATSGFYACASNYKIILRVIFDAAPLVSQTTQGPEGQQITGLTSNYLCLQCSAVVSEEDLPRHGNEKKHRFYIDSRNGTLYCQMCDDFVWDPTLEELRIRKMGTGSFSPRKRKRTEMAAEAAKAEAKYVASNTTIASCRANGLRGIYNAGATCYQNVVLQCFLHNPLLRNFYLGDGHPGIDCPPHCLSCAMDDMFQDFYAIESTNGYTAASILSAFWISEKKAFANLVTTREQDAHEFFQFLAEELHECHGVVDSRPGSPSDRSCTCIIHQTFYGKLQTTTICQSCGTAVNSTQSFLDLSLGLDNLTRRRARKQEMRMDPAVATLSLEEVLDEEYVRSDRCEYRCTVCDSQQLARRHTSIRLLPNVLCIQLKRFEFINGSNKVASKIDTRIHFPLQLNMVPYTSRSRNQDSKENLDLARACTYDLLGVVVHVGEIETGHYVSYCRVGDQWFMFNDHKVVLAQKSDVLSAQAYLLFYIVRTLS